MRDKDHEWIIEHEQELERKYSGKYVAVVDGTIVAVERTSLEADKKGREKTKKLPLVTYVPKSGEELVLI
jgi:hypothetical protein|uniref:DUF5678 domain-containing protein n=1 Tax=Candidatus Methanogaster sp. ANME-2c ERB4 TaxID=2759911 RepID=A0A7G9YEI0_9EURY|nr:hypothetical protein NIBJONLA_00031 [Methanosarcinales archaeon ANME-2c ERB4]